MILKVLVKHPERIVCPSLSEGRKQKSNRAMGINDSKGKREGGKNNAFGVDI